MQTNPAVEQNKTLNGPLVREISPVGEVQHHETEHGVFVRQSRAYMHKYLVLHLQKQDCQDASLSH